VARVATAYTPVPDRMEDATTLRMRKPDPEIARMKTWASVLDRFIDPVLGLIVPGVGDALGSALGFGVIASAVRRKLPAIVIARMLLNLAIDAVFGAVPLLGDVFDFVHQANTKNLALLEARHETRKSTPRDWAIVGVALLALVAAVVGAIYIAYKITSFVCSAL
jgi:hypothetical protein